MLLCRCEAPHIGKANLTLLLHDRLSQDLKIKVITPFICNNDQFGFFTGAAGFCSVFNFSISCAATTASGSSAITLAA